MNENQHTEWKASWRDEYLKWICGFANAHGGVLEIGRDDDGRVVGLTDAHRLLEELPNKVRDLLGVVGDMELIEEDGHPLLRISVAPYPVPISYRGEYHYRSGSTKQVLKGAALDRFLLSKTGRRWDSVPVPGVSVSDLGARHRARHDGLSTGLHARAENSPGRAGPLVQVSVFRDLPGWSCVRGGPTPGQLPAEPGKYPGISEASLRSDA